MAQTIFHFLGEPLVDETLLQGLPDGYHQVKVTPAGAKIMVQVVGGKVSSTEAQDEAGNPLPMFFIRERRPIARTAQSSLTERVYEDVCHSCVGGEFAGGEVFCYDHKCLPDPEDTPM